MKKTVAFVSVILIGICVLGIYNFNSCSSIFRGSLMDSNVQSITINLDGNQTNVTNKGEVEQIVKQINHCPRDTTEEMSFEDPGDNILYINYDDSSSEELYYLTSQNAQLLYKNYLIKTELNLENY